MMPHRRVKDTQYMIYESRLGKMVFCLSLHVWEACVCESVCVCVVMLPYDILLLHYFGNQWLMHVSVNQFRSYARFSCSPLPLLCPILANWHEHKHTPSHILTSMSNLSFLGQKLWQVKGGEIFVVQRLADHWTERAIELLVVAENDCIWD